MDEQNSKIEELIETGSELAGSTTGAAIGGGPAGAIGGAISGPIITSTFKKIGAELKERKTSNREEIRTGAAFTFALNKIGKRLDEGEEIRDDGFINLRMQFLSN